MREKKRVHKGRGLRGDGERGGENYRGDKQSGVIPRG